VGINVAILSKTGAFEGVGLAVPSSLAGDVVRQILASGKVTHGYLGVSLYPLSTDLSDAFHLPEGEGAFVVDVARGSPAEQAGLKTGDVILEVNGAKVENNRQLRTYIAKKSPGTRLHIKVRRVGSQHFFTATLGDLVRLPRATGQMRQYS
jgi:serine protease Do